MAQLIDMDQLSTPLAYDDTLSAVEVEGSESSAVDFEQVAHALLSQFKRIIHGDDPGNWYDDPASVFGADASLGALLGGTGVGRPIEVDFESAQFVEVNHGRGARPLVQVLLPIGDGWNSESWNLGDFWNLGGWVYQRMADPTVLHLSLDYFTVTFDAPTTGKVIFF